MSGEVSTLSVTPSLVERLRQVRGAFTEGVSVPLTGVAATGLVGSVGP